MRGLADRFRREEGGAAAVELAIIAPVLIGGLVAMADIGLTIQSKYDVERRARLGVEGILRFGDDKNAVKEFANSNGNSAFGVVSNLRTNPATVDVKRYQVCRVGNQVIKSELLTALACVNKPEIWFEVAASGTSSSLFGGSYQLKSTLNVMVKS
jgi:Flp pilus assembly protein TadG